MTAFVAKGDGKTVTLASSEWARAMTYLKSLEDLVTTLLENDPNDLISDGGHTVLDLWRHQARETLGRPLCRQFPDLASMSAHVSLE